MTGYRRGGYRELSVPAALRDTVAATWVYSEAERAVPTGPSRAFRILPETGVSLCFIRRMDGDRAAGGRTRPVSRDLRIMGPIRSARTFRPDPGLRMAGVRVKPEWCRELLGIDPAEHDDRIDGLPDPLARRLGGIPMNVGARSGAYAERDDREAFDERWIVDWLVGAVGALAEDHRPGRTASLAHRMLEGVRRHPASALDLSDRSRELGVSTRHLRRVVRETTGHGPKYFHRVRRLQHAVVSAEREARPDWGRVALLTGYADQSHLTRECSSLTGLSPTRLIAERPDRAPAAEIRTTSS